jgi:hypothetical protein
VPVHFVHVYKFDKETHELYSYRSFIRDYDGAIREINIPKRALEEEALDGITGNLPPRADRHPFNRDEFYNISKEDEGDEEEEKLLNEEEEDKEENKEENKSKLEESKFDSRMNLREELSSRGNQRSMSNLDESQHDRIIRDRDEDADEESSGNEDEEKDHFKKK